jgi:hypothetical protein
LCELFASFAEDMVSCSNDNQSITIYFNDLFSKQLSTLRSKVEEII